ncbi:EEF1A lysine methyltransferase 3-like isoform X2 [Stegostoma tigrinum]|uniref:EEF1A lysine methyltransferase 3-like isoform X2 n=1 Tax=Stegostoma tigrinum TaxID=3053191 RepID=UPI00202ACC29|nr:EEF1A lysine methyltransferase 3-like isoform X2 [Stegostoma tigrinum]
MTLEHRMSRGDLLEALVLCQYFQDKKLDFTGKKVLELGSGTGIVGILAALLGGQVTITDVPDALKQIQYNVDANIPDAYKHRSKVRALHWGTDQDNFPSDYDFILGSDIVYSPSLFPGLIETLVHCCNENTTIYLSTNMPARMGTESFHKELITRQFDSELVHTTGIICIYKVTKKRAR